MSNISIVGYATIMDPENARKIGLEGTPDVVWINDHQRFFGFPDYNLEGKTLNEIFDADGKLAIPNIGATTVQPSEAHKYNAVVYNNISGNVVAELDRIEGDSHLVRLPLNHNVITTFEDNRSWDNGGNPVFVYVAEQEIRTPEGRVLQMLRDDVNPHAAYLSKCRAAADVQGERFRRGYEETTFLSDRVTSLIKAD